MLTLLRSALVLSFMLISAEAFSYGDAGCGLGSLIWTRNTISSQVAALTTNMSASQSLGMTLGTSGCKAKGIVQKDKQQEVYIAQNFDSLLNDLSRGKGEYVNNLSYLLGCSLSGHLVTTKLLQENFTNIVPAMQTAPIEVLGNIKNLLNQSEFIRTECADIGHFS